MVRNFPRPTLTAVTKEWLNPACVVGATRLAPQQRYERENVIQTCQDGADETNPNPIPECAGAPYGMYPRRITVTATAPDMRGRLTTSTSSEIECDPDLPGPGWVDSGRDPLPEPTATVTSIAGPFTYDTFVYYRVEGTVTNTYRGYCSAKIVLQRPDGGYGESGMTFYVAPGSTLDWAQPYWFVSLAGVPTTTATVRCL